MYRTWHDIATTFHCFAFGCESRSERRSVTLPIKPIDTFLAVNIQTGGGERVHMICLGKVTGGLSNYAHQPSYVIFLV